MVNSLKGGNKTMWFCDYTGGGAKTKSSWKFKIHATDSQKFQSYNLLLNALNVNVIQSTKNDEEIRPNPRGEMGVSQNVIISISLSLSLFFFPDISSRQTKASKGLIPTTFGETYYKEKNLNSKQYTMAWQVTHGPDWRMFSILILSLDTTMHSIVCTGVGVRCG